MGKLEERQKYLRNCATTLQGQLGLKPDQFEGHKTFVEIEVALRGNMRGLIEARLMDSPDEQVGKLACVANDRETRRLAAEAVIPAIAQKIWAELNPKKVIKCRFCDFTIPKFARRRPGTAFEIMRDHIEAEHPDKADAIVNHAFGGRDARNEAEDEEAAAGQPD